MSQTQNLKVALVYPHTLAGVPFGILSIAGVLLEKNIPVKVFDFDDNTDGFIDRIASYNPDIVAFSLTTPQVMRAKAITTALRTKFPKAFYLAGGVHPTAMPVETVRDVGLDAVVFGEGEMTILELYDNLNTGKALDDVKGIAYRAGSDIKQNAAREMIADISILPTIPYHAIDFHRYLMPPGNIRGYWLNRATYLLSSRGCPYQCIYCASNLVFQRKVRYRPIDDIIKEIDILVNEYGIEGIQFLDDIFSVKEERVREFAEKIKKKPYKLVFSCQMRVDTVTEPMLKLLKDCGFVQVEFGIESGSEKVLKTLKKGIKLEQIRNAVKLTHKHGLRVMATFMIGSPGETEEDMKLTEELVAEINPDFVDFFYITPYPGTALYDMAVQNNWIKEPAFDKWITTSSPVMQAIYGADDLIRFRTRLQNRFMFKNYRVYFTRPLFFLRAVWLFISNPKALWNGIKAFIKAGSLNVFAVAFLFSYRQSWRNRVRKNSIVQH